MMLERLNLSSSLLEESASYLVLVLGKCSPSKLGAGLLRFWWTGF
jgi:hypothetical protein